MLSYIILYALSKIWNSSLLLHLREIETLRKRLKAYYFNLAFEDASILLFITVDAIPLLCTKFISVKLFSLNAAMAPLSNLSTSTHLVDTLFKD